MSDATGSKPFRALSSLWDVDTQLARSHSEPSLGPRCPQWRAASGCGEGEGRLNSIPTLRPALVLLLLGQCSYNPAWLPVFHIAFGYQQGGSAALLISCRLNKLCLFPPQKWDGLSRNVDLLSLRKPVSWLLWISNSEKLWKWMCEFRLRDLVIFVQYKVISNGIENNRWIICTQISEQEHVCCALQCAVVSWAFWVCGKQSFHFGSKQRKRGQVYQTRIPQEKVLPLLIKYQAFRL